jgi:DNA modification methylase
VARDLGRTPLAFDLAPQRPEIKRADARALPLHDAAADFTFIDPPYSKHIDYSDDTRCIGKLDAAALADADDQPNPYFTAMADVIAEIDRTLRPGRFMALYVSDSFTKTGAASLGDRAAPGAFSPIGFQLFSILAFHFQPIDIIAVVRHNQKLERGHWRQAAEKGNFFLRGFNYLFILRKPDATPRARRPARR